MKRASDVTEILLDMTLKQRFFAGEIDAAQSGLDWFTFVQNVQDPHFLFGCSKKLRTTASKRNCHRVGSETSDTQAAPKRQQSCCVYFGSYVSGKGWEIVKKLIQADAFDYHGLKKKTLCDHFKKMPGFLYRA